MVGIPSLAHSLGNGWLVSLTVYGLPANAVRYGYLLNTSDPTEERINETVHWSVFAKRQHRTAQPYLPPNLPYDIPPHKIVEITKEEQALLEACGVVRPEHS